MGMVKMEFHDADIDILARMSARMSASVSWNASLKQQRGRFDLDPRSRTIFLVLSSNDEVQLASTVHLNATCVLYTWTTRSISLH